MRRIAWALVCLPLAACAAPTTSDDGSGRATAMWKGALQSVDTCIGGDLFLLLESEDGSSWSGSAYYESELWQGEHFRATYAVQGSVEGGKLHLKETALSEADDGQGVLRWCTGDYRLNLGGTDPMEQSSLDGEYIPFDCDCSGAPTKLEPAN